MNFLRPGALLGACLTTAALCLASVPSDISARVELKRADLSGAAGMEVISSVTEFKPGEGLAAHSHHGIETGYVLQGALVQYPGKAPAMLETGTAIMNLRDVPHGGFKVVGDQPLKLFTVHIVDKDKPLYEWVK